MSVETGIGTEATSTTADALLRFAAHLRDTPEAVHEEAGSLAEQFGLPVDIVTESLGLARAGRTHRIKSKVSGTGVTPGTLFRGLMAGIRRHPLLAAAIVSLVFFGTYKYIQAYAAASKDLYAVISLLTGLFLLSAINFVRGQVRFACYTSVVAVICGAVAAAGIDIVIGHKIVTATMLRDTFFTAVVFVILLTAFFSISAVFGALARIRRQGHAERNLDRLQLLQRVFNLQERLAATKSSGREEMRFRSWLQSARQNWIWIALACGCFVGLLTLIQMLIFGDMGRNPSVVEQSFFLLILILLMTLFPAIGFVAGDWVKGLTAGFVAYVVSFGVWLLPIDGLGLDQLKALLRNNPASFINAAILIVMAVIGGMGGAIDKRLEHGRRIESADQTAMLSELIRLQQLLQTGSAEVCVMAVDCVKSTRMKQDADSLAVEISFREFHEFLSREVLRHGGSIHAIAGDGAVAEFSSVSNAFDAARQIQTLLPEFNKHSNRLAAPFKVRIGLHCGSVHGGLEQVVFASVIDIAAHIEKHATTGGIIATDAVVMHLQDHEFLPMAEQVDGVKVLLAKHPTLD